MLTFRSRAATLSLLAAATVAGCAPATPVSTTSTAQTAAASLTVDAGAGAWAPLVVQDLAAARPAAPPVAGSAAVEAELAELRAWQSRRSADDRTAISYWNDTVAPVRWSEITRDLIVKYGLVPPRAARAHAVVHAAIYDATIASWRAKAEFRRPAPAAVAQDLEPLVREPGVPSYPSEHAAVAAAAAGALAQLFPAEAAQLRARALAAAETRVAAGANYRSDVTAGLAIGEAVAKQVALRAETDGSAVKAGPIAVLGADRWNHNAPMEPLAGTWRTWFLTRGSQFRLAEPPRMGTPEYPAMLAEVIAIKPTLTPEQQERAIYWNYDVPSIMWNDRGMALVKQHKLSFPRAARTLAYLNALEADAFIACWDTKYAIRQPRPVHGDPSFVPFVTTPPHPSYPSGHATASQAAAMYLSTVFPEARDRVMAEAQEAAMSRLWGGIHYRRDNDDGLKLGARIAEVAIAKAKMDGLP